MTQNRNDAAFDARQIRTKLAKAMMRSDRLIAHRNGDYSIRRRYMTLPRNMTARRFAEDTLAHLLHNDILIEIISSGDHGMPWPRPSYLFVRFRVQTEPA